LQVSHEVESSEYTSHPPIKYAAQKYPGASVIGTSLSNVAEFEQVTQLLPSAL